ncbi:hypothetical protein OAL70_04505, partial [Pelagibacteraceae bacterium]|nr:hypothetical protein [Pelagibacteraceae bacterium]
MQKIIYSVLSILISLIILFTVYLSTVGLETTRFNNIIINEIKKKESDVQLSLGKIKIKFDIKKIQIYLSTENPLIIYQNIKIPIKEINLYTKIISILKSKNEINQAIISAENFNIKDIQKLAIRIKPSNFKTFLLNNINNGEVEKILINVKLGENLNINDYKVNGSLKKINIEASKNLKIRDVSFNFISDRNLTLINSLKAKYQGILISNGSLSLKTDKQKDIEGKFNSQFDLSGREINKLVSTSNIKFLENNNLSVKGSMIHNFKFKLDENFKLVDYDYKSNGKILESQIELKEKFKSQFVEKQIKKFLISKADISINLNNQNNNFLMLEGLY